MWKRKALLGLLLGLFYFTLPFVSLAQSSQDVPPQKENIPLTTMSSHIKEKLQDLKVQSNSITARLEIVSKTLEESEKERLELKEQSTRLSISLMNINRELNDCYRDIENYKRTLEERTVVLTYLAILMVIRVLAVAVGYILYFKGIKVPRWLDILL